MMKKWRSLIQLSILAGVLVACLHFVYRSGFVPKDVITVVLTSLAAAMIKLLDLPKGD